MIRHKDRINHCNLNQTIYITDDDPRRIGQYNCLGFVLGRMSVFLPPNKLGNNIQSFQNDLHSFLKDLGCDHHPNELEDAEQGFALLLDGPAWHVAKHLWGDWYESKDYLGLRFVHELKTISDSYQGTPSFWTIDQTSDGKRKRDKFIEKNYRQGSFTPPEQGSISDCLEELKLDPARLIPGELESRLKIAADQRGGY